MHRRRCQQTRPGRTLPPGKTRYPFYRRLGGPQGRSGRAENLVPTGIRSQTVQPLVAIPTELPGPLVHGGSIINNRGFRTLSMQMNDKPTDKHPIKHYPALALKRRPELWSFQYGVLCYLPALKHEFEKLLHCVDHCVGLAVCVSLLYWSLLHVGW